MHRRRRSAADVAIANDARSSDRPRIIRRHPKPCFERSRVLDVLRIDVHAHDGAGIESVGGQGGQSTSASDVEKRQSRKIAPDKPADVAHSGIEPLGVELWDESLPILPEREVCIEVGSLLSVARVMSANLERGKSVRQAHSRMPPLTIRTRDTGRCQAEICCWPLPTGWPPSHL